MRVSFAMVFIFSLLSARIVFAQDPPLFPPENAEKPDAKKAAEIEAWKIQAEAWKKESIESLREKQQKAAKEWLQEIGKVAAAGIEIDDTYSPIFAVRDTKLVQASTKSQRLEILKEQIDLLQPKFEKIEGLYKANKPGGESKRYEEVKFYLLRARIQHFEEEDVKSLERIKELEQLRMEWFAGAEVWIRTSQTDRVSMPVTHLNSKVHWIEARLATIKSKEDRLSALKTHVEMLQVTFDKIYALYKTNSRGGEAKFLEHARFYLCDAKIRRALEEGAESIKALREEKLKAAEAWLKGVNERTYGPRFDYFASLPPILAIKTAALELANSKSERSAALLKSIEDLQQHHDIIEVHYKSNMAGGEGDKIGAATYHLLDAEIQYKLEEAKK